MAKMAGNTITVVEAGKKGIEKAKKTRERVRPPQKK